MTEKTEKETPVTAVILSFNRCAEVLVTLQQLKNIRKKLSFNIDIVVVDNGSTDDTRIKVNNAHPDINYVFKPQNNGIAGWNKGFEVVKSKYILVLDDDSCIVNGLPEAVNFLDNNPATGILALNIVDKNLQGDAKLKPEEGWQHLQQIAGFIGCGALLRTELYNLIGGFAEWIYLYTHEFEYAIRCLNAGYNIVFFQKSDVMHRVSSVNRASGRLRTYSTRNELGIVYKYFGYNRNKYLSRVLFNNLKFIKRDGLKAGYYIMTGFFEFLKLKKKLAYTPVSRDVQNFYAENFWSTKPVFFKKSAYK